MDSLSFKERVAQAANNFAPQYKNVFVDYEYLLCSDAFSDQGYYIIDAEEDNFRHLLGVHTCLTPSAFYEKCLKGELTDCDFDFVKAGHDEKSVKGSVRRKIASFPSFLSMMTKDLVVQESFSKNKVFCSIATTDCAVTVGFIGTNGSRPRTLLKGDQIDWQKAGTVDLILRKPSGDSHFKEVVSGDQSAIEKYFPQIKDLISPEIYPARNIVSV